jgi:NADH-quinone oxidoreductase subunit J
MLESTSVLFYIMALIIIVSAACVVLVPNPIYSALSLAGSMIGLGFVYFLLGAEFVAGVQLIVYAGAVMVLFVMVLMLFDLKKDVKTFSDNQLGLIVKILSGVVLSFIFSWAIRTSLFSGPEAAAQLTPAAHSEEVKNLAVLVFTKYLFAFESLGILLLVIAVGVVSIARARGGTHARD